MGPECYDTNNHKEKSFLTVVTISRVTMDRAVRTSRKFKVDREARVLTLRK